MTSSDFEAQEFVSVAFSPANEASHLLLTLTGAPDWTLMLWHWDNMSLIAHTKIDPEGPKKGLSDMSFLSHCSFSPHDPACMIVSGGGLYKYFVMKDKRFTDFHSTMNNKPQEISSKYTCHCWGSDGRLMVGTEEGHIILCHDNGEYQSIVAESPNGVHITCITPFSRGVLVGGSEGEIFIFIQTDDVDVPLKF